MKKATIICILAALIVRPSIWAQNSSRVQTEWVRHYAAELWSFDDYVTAMTVDHLGNVYVTGASKCTESSYDYATVKYNFSGKLEWAVCYDGLANDYDVPTAIAVDASGNVYVTGKSPSRRARFSEDFATIKYNQAGAQEWVARYNGPGDGQDVAHAIAVDGSGNAYVAGSATNASGSVDCVTIKYSPSGVQEWIVTYNGPGNSVDGANAIAVDRFGNVYVTGISDAGQEVKTRDFCTIKYNSAGEQLCVSRYNGPDDEMDYAVALAADGAGNVYVTGLSWKNAAVGYDYATVKYDSSGLEIWVARYNGPDNFSDEPTALAVDNPGNVFVTGQSLTSFEKSYYATIKYDSTGKQQWVARYIGAGNRSDKATGIGIDALGNIFVTGASYEGGFGTDPDFVTLKYTPLGTQEWVQRYDGYQKGYDEAITIAVLPSGVVYVAGVGTGSSKRLDYVTIKYDVLGAIEWLARYDGPGSSKDQAVALAMDAEGNAFVTGRSYSTATHDDFVTIKYNASGEQQWVARHDSLWDDGPAAITTDNLGNAYVTGTNQTLATGADIATVKYNSAGVIAWVAHYDYSGSKPDRAAEVAVDASRNVYVTGESDEEIATIKYTPDGAQQWVVRYRGGEPTAMAIDKNSNVYVAGIHEEPLTDPDYITLKYDSTGVQQWSARFGAYEYSNDRATDLAVDDPGNVFITGWSLDSLGFWDFATVKYNASGQKQWDKRFNSGFTYHDYPNSNISIVVEASGKVYVSGTYMRSTNNQAFVVIKYSESGMPEWIARYDSLVWSTAANVAVDPEGNLYVTGRGMNTDSAVDYVTIKYNPSGILQWVTQYNSPGNYYDDAIAIALDTFGHVYVTGTSWTQNNSTVITTIKYAQTQDLPQDYNLLQNYPNPFNTNTTIKYDLPKPTHVRLVIFDILGRKVRTLVDEQPPAAFHIVEWDGCDEAGMPVASGVYFYRISASQFVRTKKMLLLR